MQSMAVAIGRRFNPAGSTVIGRAVGLAVYGVGIFGMAAVAWADVKVVTEVNVTQQPEKSAGEQTPSGMAVQPNFPETITTYYKGSHALLEVTDGPSVLYDGSGGKVYRFDPVTKTYYILTMKKMLEQQGRLTGRMADRVDVDAKVDVKASDAADTLEVCGLTARKYDLSGSLSFSPKQDGGFAGRREGGGGFPGGMNFGGGFPGGGGGGFPGRGGRGRGGGHRQHIPATLISGVLWLSDKFKLPDDKKSSMLPAVQQLIFEGSPALKPFADSLGKTKMLPLETEITLTKSVRAAPGSNDSDTGLDDSGQEVSTQTTTTKMEVKSISNDALPDSLFQVKPGYTLVNAPADDTPSD